MRKSTMFLPALALGVAGAICVAAPSLAEQITYTMQVIGTGCLGDAAIMTNCLASPTFSQENVTLTMVNDLGNRMYDSTLGLYEINGTATVSVDGGAPATFFDTIQVYTDSSTIVGFYDAASYPPTGYDILDENNTALNGYELGAIGPTTDVAALGINQPYPPPITPPFYGFPLTTSGDYFLFTGVGSDATFTATVAAVPAPPIGRGLSVALAVGGTLFGANLLRRRFRNPLT